MTSTRALFDPRYMLAAAALAVLSLFFAALARAHTTFPLDRELGSQARGLGSVYAPVAEVANEYSGLIGVALASVAIAILLARRRPDAAVLFVAASALRPLLNEAKTLVDRPRPAGDFAMLDVVSDSSFPSGHVMTAVIFFGLWFLLASELLPQRWVIPARVVTATAIVLVALSRMWAGVHWFSDTYGALLWAGVLLALLMALRPSVALGCQRIGATLPRLAQRSTRYRSWFR